MFPRPDIAALYATRLAMLACAAMMFRLPANLHAQTGSAQSSVAGRDAKPTALADQRYRFRLLGVYDEQSGEPIEGVEVSDIFSRSSSLTTKTGTVSLFFLPDSGSFVRLRKVGYAVRTIPIAISPRDTTPITILLQRVKALPAVTVKAAAPNYLSPRLRAAEDRVNAHSGGYFIDEAELRKWDNSTLANAIISKMPGLMSSLGPHGEVRLISTRKMCLRELSCRTPNCFISVYLDGVPVTQLPDFSRMTPADFAIAEFYPSPATEPVEYGGACGALLLWSRER